MRSKKITVTKQLKPVHLAVFALVFAAAGVFALVLTRAASVTIDNNLPKPTNLKVYPDDRVATVTWDAPSTAGSANIVGYLVKWGKKSGGVMTDAKQTTYLATQIQPLENGVEYNVTVQAVQGTTPVQVATPGAHHSGSATEQRASGKVSPTVPITVTASSARVDWLRSQMTGFFDDFNQSAGAFDELKWNSAGSTCVPPGSQGAFINGQFHAHSEARAAYGNLTYCDRGQFVNRPRGVFDITGKTESNPGIITFDFDGVTHSRDVWYIDLVPLSARKSGAPLDITSHQSAFDDDTSDPVMIRMKQGFGGESIGLTAYDANKAPIELHATYTNCPDFKGDLSFDSKWCSSLGAATPGLSPLAEPPINTQLPGAMPNIRRHWRLEVSGTKIKVFVDSIKMIEADMPAHLQNTKQWTIHNNLFTYNTGKDDETNPTTSMLHWDNFGFNGPAQTTEVHNYIDGGADGQTPYVGKGSLASQVPGGDRSLKINIPDPIGNPVKARLMFTFGSLGYGGYKWQSGDGFVINGKTYAYANPTTNSIQAPNTTPDIIADTSRMFADSISVSPADLKQGMNDIKLNFAHGSGELVMINVHMELEYTKGTQPTYTQPITIFGSSKLIPQIQPTMTSHDNYLFIEQDLGLTGIIDHNMPMPPPPPPPPADTTPPTVSLTAPTSSQSISGSFTLTASASDTGGTVSTVSFYLDGSNTALATDTSSPYTFTWPTAAVTNGSHSLVAKAIDTSGNVGSSSSVTFTVTNIVADTTAPTTTITAPAASASLVDTTTVQAMASDEIGVTKVELYIDGSLAATDTSSPYSFAWNTKTYTNGSHTLRTRAYDAANNNSYSATITVTVSNPVTPPSTPKAGDVNNDGSVNITDLSILASNYGLSGRTRGQGDLTGDGVVNVIDLSIVSANIGK